MATAYERYKKDTASKEVDTIKDYSDFQKAVLQALEKQTDFLENFIDLEP